MISVTPQSLKQNLLDFRADRNKQFTDNKPQLIDFMLEVLDASSKAGSLHVSMDQFIEVAGIFSDSVKLDVKGASGLINDNKEELKQSLIDLGFKFNTDYIVFEEQ